MCYVVYHIIGVKVGCTDDYPRRCYRQGFKDGEFEILDTWPMSVGDNFVGNREWEWCDAFGYERGPHYSENWNSRSITQEMREHAGKRTAELYFTSEHQSMAGKIGGSKGGAAKLGTSGFQTGVAQRASAKGPNHISKRPDINMVSTGVAGRLSAAGPNHISKQFFSCPYCGKSGFGAMWKRHVSGLNCPILGIFAATNIAIEDHV
jgi:hypothetical protein